jgi:hypothetical protein
LLHSLQLLVVVVAVALVPLALQVVLVVDLVVGTFQQQQERLVKVLPVGLVLPILEAVAVVAQVQLEQLL